MGVQQNRTDEIRLIKTWMPKPWIKYIGKSDSFSALDNEEWWQIRREVQEGNLWTSTFAKQGSFKAKWSERESYFPAILTNYSAYLQDMGADFVSDTMVNVGDGISLQLVWSGNDSGTGVAKIETSNDGAEWCDYTADASFTIPITAGCQPFDLARTKFPFFRIKYTKGGNTSGELSIAYWNPR